MNQSEIYEIPLAVEKQVAHIKVYRDEQDRQVLVGFTDGTELAIDIEVRSVRRINFYQFDRTLGSSSHRVVHLGERCSALSFQAASFGPAPKIRTVSRPRAALSLSMVLQTRSRRSRSSSPQNAGCRTVSGSSSVIMTPHFA